MQTFFKCKYKYKCTNYCEILYIYILVYLLKGQNYRNENWIYIRVVSVLLVYQYISTVLCKKLNI